MIASSVALTEMSSPGKSSRSCCWSVVIGRLDDEVVLLAIGRAPDDQADRAGALPSMRISRGCTTVASATAGIRHRDADDVEVAWRTVDRPAVSGTRSMPRRRRRRLERPAPGPPVADRASTGRLSADSARTR